MIETALGLVLRTRPLTETSLIVHWLTPTLGRLATVAKGARRPKSPFRGKLDLFYLADLSFNRSRTSDLHNLREVNVRETHVFLRQELAYLRQASYCVSLIEQATETETPLGVVFEMLRSFLAALPAHPPQPQLILGFELKLLGELGLQPDLAETKLTAGAKALVGHLQQADWSGVSRLRLNAAQQSELGHFLQRFLLFHLGRIPKGREALVN
jgi:DNA repair protein RecO (recombination protein O)